MMQSGFLKHSTTSQLTQIKQTINEQPHNNSIKAYKKIEALLSFAK